jgi:23S rRNA pseudouridine2457 synthase
MTKLYLFNKPFGVLSQFRDDGSGRPTLAKYINTPDIYPAGRLDQDSEGLLLLTGNGKLQHWISHPNHKQPKTYWAQVEGVPTESAIKQLRDGVELNDGPTKPAQAKIIEQPAIWNREPPIRYRANIPTRWIELTITEGRNRQVRRMTAAIGHPTLRLVRASIGDWDISAMQLGEVKVVDIELPKEAQGISQKHPRRQNPQSRNSKNTANRNRNQNRNQNRDRS